MNTVRVFPLSAANLNFFFTFYAVHSEIIKLYKMLFWLGLTFKFTQNH